MQRIKPYLLGSAVFLVSPNTIAESLGIHCWQQEPFSHILCFEVEAIQGGYYSLIGEDLLPKQARYPVRGSALFDEFHDVFRLEFTQNFGGAFIFENSVILDKQTLSGTWTDESGASGNFSYLGAGPLNMAQ